MNKKMKDISGTEKEKEWRVEREGSTLQRQVVLQHYVDVYKFGT